MKTELMLHDKCVSKYSNSFSKFVTTNKLNNNAADYATTLDALFLPIIKRHADTDQQTCCRL